jgi:hypothetical protein
MHPDGTARRTRGVIDGMLTPTVTEISRLSPHRVSAGAPQPVAPASGARRSPSQ